MAQTGYTPILIYSSSTGGNSPAAGNLTNSTLGSELAINITDGKLFYKDNANAVQVIGWKVVPATAGGTGQTSYTTGDILYASSTTALSKLADVATGNALISGGVGVAPSWGKIGLTTHVSGTLPIANGGTNQTSFTGKSGNICGLVFFDGTSFQNDATVSHVGYDTVANTFYANNVNFSGTVTLASALPVGQGGTGTSTAFTAGSVVYAGASGVYSQDNSNFFWDATNHRLGLGTTSPQRLAQLGARGGSSVTADCQVQNLTIGGKYQTSGSTDQWSFISWQFTSDSDSNPFSVTPGSEAGKNWYVGPFSPVGYFQQGRFAFVSNGTEKLSIFSAGGVSIGNTTDPGATNLSVTGKVSVSNTFESTAYVGINSSTVTTVATGVSFLAVVRDRGNGDTALVLYENNVTPVIVSQTNASKFTTSAPGASQIQLANLSGGGGMTAKSGSTIGNDNLNITIIKNQ